MTRRELERYRAALHAAVDAFCGRLAADLPAPAPGYVRPAATPDQQPDDLQRQKARNELRRKGILR